MINEEKVAPTFKYAISCVRDGVEQWREDFANLVTTAGKNDLLTQYFKGASYTAGWYCGLISSTGYTTGVAVTDTAASHAGWTEDMAYTEAARPGVTFGSAGAGGLSTSSASAFNINGTTTLKGAFVITDNTKSGTTGTLYSAGLFTTGDRAVLDGDVVSVSITMSA